VGSSSLPSSTAIQLFDLLGVARFQLMICSNLLRSRCTLA
jgi:hypothetical protein